MLSLRFWSLALGPIVSVLSQTVPVAPSNTSSYNPNASANETAVLVTSQLSDYVPLFALTKEAQQSLNANDDPENGPSINIIDVTANNTQLVNNTIIYVSCDPDDWRGDITFASVVNNAINANVSAIIFYSLHDSFCTLSGSLPKNYGPAFSTVNTGNATVVMQHLTGMFGSSSAEAMLLTLENYNNAVENSSSVSGIGGSPSTAVAMIILYSITGIITALFLLIIITGAIRAHRHPERYGPRNVLGRPRQGRAKGIARAMLETIPIVKFEDKEPTKPTDVELAETVAPTTERPSSTEQSRDAPAQTVSGTDVEREESSNSAVEGGIQELPENKDEDNSLGCSICTEDFEKGQDLRVLPCKHKFHPACVDPWLLDVSGTCPLCRVDLRSEATPAADDQEHPEGQGDLPPPLDPATASNSNRRRPIRNFFDRHRLQSSTREERLTAIRNYRLEQQDREPAASADDHPEAEQRENEGRWRRVRRSLRLGGNPNTNSVVVTAEDEPLPTDGAIRHPT